MREGELSPAHAPALSDAPIPPTASSGATPLLRLPFPSSTPGNESIWRNSGPYYSSDYLIAWPRAHKDVPRSGDIILMLSLDY
ncbi:hypothetical protein O1611_g4721 [Lasiodiplodia mahajangana]|uniref:Uncharacterized protein n=1 Tax=Lasiodiplodia mahajangana TaxID=1108764 RepID=A0ACC2JN63_9PEZI|nr:hypothetical protein O1611_g4721 [Lasiodiplodia mahajangana]